MPVEIEVRTREELHEALDGGAEHLLLDNLTPAEAAEWVREIGGRATVELSGGITLENGARLCGGRRRFCFRRAPSRIRLAPWISASGWS